MDRRSTLRIHLFFLKLCGIYTGFVQAEPKENCTEVKIHSEMVFSVPGDAAMLNSTLVTPNIVNFTAVPYNITWYNSKTGQEVSNRPGRVLVRGETLWFIHVTLEDDGEYMTILRTPTCCYRQVIKLVVDQPVAGECGRPRKAAQELTMGVTDTLFCPLKDYIKKLDSYNVASSIKWYRGCDPIQDGIGRYTYRNKNKLKIDGVEPDNNGSYTCTLSFTLGGVKTSVSETINGWVGEYYCLTPRVHEPASEIVKAEIGSSFSRRCQVFVPCVGEPFTDLVWMVRGGLILDTQPSTRIHTSEQRMSRQDVPPKGVWLERLLIISKLREDDFHINYTCGVFSDRGHQEAYFTLLPADPNLILPIGLVFGGASVLSIITVIIYYLFRVDIVLSFRRAFPVLYANKDLDGKLYDAYVAYPPPHAIGYSKKVETFAIHALPEVLEKSCGYKLFIAGRDCVPGQALVDSVEENIQASRRLLLLYTSSTFTGKKHTSSTSSNNNNHFTKSNNVTEHDTNGKTGDHTGSSDGDVDDYSDTRLQLECVAAMHRALLEGSLKVVLVELEEITPAQLALFPESVRHLRKKQGAVCWWTQEKARKRRRTCVEWREEEEKGGEDVELSPSLSPSLRFWKEMRYHMPVRGKREVYPEKCVLLNS